MVRRWNQLHEMFLDDISVFIDRDRHIFENHSLVAELLSKIMINHLTVILSSDTCEHRALGFWDTEALKGVFDGIRYVIP